MPDNALSVTLDDAIELPSPVLQALYRITGRSTVELRRDILAGQPLYTAPLFGPEHIDVVPRLEKTLAYLRELGLGFTVQDWVDATAENITPDTMREILEGAGNEPA